MLTGLMFQVQMFLSSKVDVLIVKLRKMFHGESVHVAIRARFRSVAVNVELPINLFSCILLSVLGLESSICRRLRHTGREGHFPDN